MKLLSRHVPDRIKIELSKNIRIDGGIMTFGEKDDYPNIIEKIVAGSVTAQATCNIYSKFLVGDGFEQEGINDIVISYDSRGKEVKVLDLLRQCADSVALYNGLYIHTPRNLNGEVSKPTLMPFKHCRFSKVDETGYTNSIVVNPNFGVRDKFKAKDSQPYDVFSSSKEVVQKRIEKAGGTDTYKGQIYFQYWDNRYLYPLSPYDTVYLDANTEWELSQYKNREIQNGFMLRHIIRVGKFESDENREKFIQQVEGMEGAEGSRVLLLEDEFDENGNILETGAFKVDKIENNVNDTLFDSWELSISNKIRKANKALPAILIDYESSKLGNTSGEALRQAAVYYNAMTQDDRKLLSRVFNEVLGLSNIPELASNTNWKIKPLIF